MPTPQTQKNTPAHVFVPLLYTQASQKQAEDACRFLTAYGFAVRKTESLRTEVYRDACRAGLIVVAGELQDATKDQQLQALQQQLILAAKDRKLHILHIGGAETRADYPHTFANLHEGFDQSPDPALVHRLFITGLIELAVGANRQDPESMYALAEAYLRAELLPYSDKQTVHWLSLAAEKQNANALVTLGLCCLEGTGTQKDAPRGFRLLENAANLGDKRGQYYAAVCLLEGTGTQPDPKRAVQLLHSSAKQGYANASLHLGICYLEGVGTAQHAAKAHNHLEDARALGNATAQYYLGTMYRDGIGVAQDDALAAQHFKESADGDVSNASYQYALCLIGGKGVSRDVSLAAGYLHRAAEGGVADAQYALGSCYEFGDGVRTDLSEAIKWYTLAAEGGSADGQNNLAGCLLYGRGCRKDTTAAIAWLKLAADAQHTGACY